MKILAIRRFAKGKYSNGYCKKKNEKNIEILYTDSNLRFVLVRLGFFVRVLNFIAEELPAFL